jgi:hypothetical protein
MMLLAVLMVTLSTRAQPATSPCDPELETRDDTAYGYRLRGERCEGLYARPLSGNSLRIASFTAALEDFDPSLDVDVSVTWDASPDAGPVQIRAHGLPRRLYYRLDTLQPAHPSRYTWPRGILAAIRIRGHDVGVLAWHRVMADSVETRVHLPVRVSQQYQKAAGSEYQLVLIPGQRLSEVYLRLGPIGPEGRIDAATPGGKALRYGHYPAERPIPVAIPRPLSTGVYYLEIGADLRGGGVANAVLYFYNPAHP